MKSSQITVFQIYLGYLYVCCKVGLVSFPLRMMGARNFSFIIILTYCPLCHFFLNHISNEYVCSIKAAIPWKLVTARTWSKCLTYLTWILKELLRNLLSAFTVEKTEYWGEKNAEITSLISDLTGTKSHVSLTWKSAFTGIVLSNYPYLDTNLYGVILQGVVFSPSFRIAQGSWWKYKFLPKTHPQR